VAHQLVHVDRLALRLAPLEQLPQPLDDPGRALVVRDDVAENLANVLRVGPVPREKALRCLRVGEDRAQRLIQLVRQRPGQLAEHRDARQLSELVALLLDVLLHMLAVRDVPRDPAYPDGLARSVELDVTDRRDPSQPTAERDAIFAFVVGAARTLREAADE